MSELFIFGVCLAILISSVPAFCFFVYVLWLAQKDFFAIAVSAASLIIGCVRRFFFSFVNMTFGVLCIFIFSAVSIVCLWFCSFETGVKIIGTLCFSGVAILALQKGWWAFRKAINFNEDATVKEVELRLRWRKKGWRR